MRSAIILALAILLRRRGWPAKPEPGVRRRTRRSRGRRRSSTRSASGENVFTVYSQDQTVIHDTGNLDRVYTVIDFRQYEQPATARPRSSASARTAPRARSPASATCCAGSPRHAAQRAAAGRAAHLRPLQERPGSVQVPERLGRVARARADAASGSASTTGSARPACTCRRWSASSASRAAGGAHALPLDRVVLRRVRLLEGRRGGHVAVHAGHGTPLHGGERLGRRAA